MAARGVAPKRKTMDTACSVQSKCPSIMLYCAAGPCLGFEHAEAPWQQIRCAHILMICGLVTPGNVYIGSTEGALVCRSPSSQPSVCILQDVFKLVQQKAEGLSGPWPAIWANTDKGALRANNPPAKLPHPNKAPVVFIGDSSHPMTPFSGTTHFEIMYFWLASSLLALPCWKWAV